MASSRRWVAALAITACALLLAGCAAPTPAPFGHDERALLRSRILNAAWAEVANQYPEALRPSVGQTRVVPDRDWPRDISHCLAQAGFVTVVTEGRVIYSSSEGQTPLEFAVRSYGCSAQYVKLSAVTALLTSKTYASLRAYYLQSARPCLLAADAPAPAPPGRAAFVAGDTEERTWNPFEAVWSGRFSDFAVDYLEARCPPVPSWLRLGD